MRRRGMDSRERWEEYSLQVGSRFALSRAAPVGGQGEGCPPVVRSVMRMAASRGSDAAEPAVLSRREAIIGALALAAGALVASRPGTALAANSDPITVAGLMVGNGATQVWRTSNQFLSGGTNYSIAVLNGTNISSTVHYGVDGIALTGAPNGSAGLHGTAGTAAQFGVLAEHGIAEGAALRVNGVAQFSRSGKATISKGHSSRTVSGLSNITADSIILVTLQGSPGTGNHVRWAKRLSGTSFQVMLTKAAAVNVTFGWLILN
jgi:hypothetical protein